MVLSFLGLGEQDESKRLEKYLTILSELPTVNAVTLRRLLSHLHFIHEESEHNLMPVENLAAIWGPTLMHVEVSTRTKLPNFLLSVCTNLIVRTDAHFYLFLFALKKA